MLNKIVESMHQVLHDVGIQEKTPKDRPMVVEEAGMREGQRMSKKLVACAMDLWRSQKGEDIDSVNSVMIMTLAKNGEESLVTFAFNPQNRITEDSMPEMEADAYLLAMEYLRGACSNRLRSDGRVRFAMDKLQKTKKTRERLSN